MIKFGISELSLIPVRREDNETSEMVSQILFGETFQIMEANKNWSYISNSPDSYTGWINTNCITYINEDLFIKINENNSFVTKELFNEIIQENGEKTIIPFGASLPFFDLQTKSFLIGNQTYSIQNDLSNQDQDIIHLSTLFLNTPYLWGGKNPLGIDCSGFIQVVYKSLNIKLPRDAEQQVSHGETINFMGNAEPGDLAFFDNEEGKIIHVGIILSKNSIIHASTKVRIDKLDQQGIFNESLNKYTHKLRIIKRILKP